MLGQADMGVALISVLGGVGVAVVTGTFALLASRTRVHIPAEDGNGTSKRNLGDAVAATLAVATEARDIARQTQSLLVQHLTERGIHREGTPSAG